MKFTGVQFNQIVCQETENRFCAQSDTFLLYYYVPVSVAVLMIAQLKNYKQVSYMARVAMVASLIAILTIIIDSLIQVLIYLRVGYSSQVVENGDGVQVHESNF